MVNNQSSSNAKSPEQLSLVTRLCHLSHLPAHRGAVALPPAGCNPGWAGGPSETKPRRISLNLSFSNGGDVVSSPSRCEFSLPPHPSVSVQGRVWGYALFLALCWKLQAPWLRAKLWGVPASWAISGAWPPDRCKNAVREGTNLSKAFLCLCGREKALESGGQPG